MPPTRLGRFDLQHVTAGLFEMARAGERKASALWFGLMDHGTSSDGVMGVANRFAIKDAKEALWLGMVPQGETNSLEDHTPNAIYSRLDVEQQKQTAEMLVADLLRHDGTSAAQAHADGTTPATST